MPAVADPPTVVAAPPGPSPEVAAQRAASTQIAVSALPKGDVPSKPPKPGSAKAKFYQEMQKKFGAEPATEPTAPAKPAATSAAKAGEASPAPTSAPQSEPGADASVTTPASGSPTPAAEAVPVPAPTEGKKVSPWKLVDQFKERATKAEARVLELEKQVLPEEQRKAQQATLDQLQARVKEMTDDLRYYRAEKYDPDIIKAKEEYSRAMNRAISELKEVSITDPATQQPRAVTVNDIAELAFMPLGQAQQVAKEVFGELAPYVMDHRNEIRRLWDSQQAKLEDLKKNGAARELERTQQAEKAIQQLNTFIEQTYEQAKQEVVADPKHGHLFRPREGDAEWNTRLEKGFKLVDTAFSRNAADPSLTKEQRVELIRMHAAVRNRAAAFGPMRYDNENLRKQLAEALAELKQYKETTPATTGRQPEAPAEKPRGMAGLMAELQKLAH